MIAEPIIQKLEYVSIGIGEMRVTRSPFAILSCIGLGSCVAVAVYDRVTRLGGMVHIILPRNDSPVIDNPARYANTAIPALFEEMTNNGWIGSHLIVKVAGGSQMSISPGLNNAFKTGERNVTEVMSALSKKGTIVSAADVGGYKGRTFKLYMDTGRFTVRTIGDVEHEI
jgi:chemotaxis protein CheD